MKRSFGILTTILTVTLIFTFTACTTTGGGKNSTDATKVYDREYTIGDEGPAGGFVFFDKGDSTGGWRYLEAAPAETEFKNVIWTELVVNVTGGLPEKATGTETGIGTGKRNTEILVAHLNSRNETGKAAHVCAELSVNGFSDWFLPSYAELNLMYENLRKNNIGGFTDGWYWSSSVYTRDYHDAWGQNFLFGYGEGSYGNYGGIVRAVRAF